MYIIDCPHHGKRTIVPLDAIRSLENTPQGIVLEIECWCGGIVTVVTGRAAPAGHLAA
jgi:hypothetical protein